MKVRTRFAPSPTGPLHIGGVRTALFNYLFAKKHGGDFLLRIEDTDQTRYVEGAEKYIMDSLNWCAITPNEGIEQGGDFGPYRQSERKELYKEYALQLVDEGEAYYAFDTPEELDAMRNRLKEEKAPNQQYGPTTRMSMNNSLTLSKEEVAIKIGSKQPYIVRFKMPENEEIILNDIIRGEVRVNSNTLDDKVLFKSDGMPTYHLANIVDDHLMEISHVIRGEEWLPSMPLHVLLYKGFGWEAPQFAHLPLLLKPNGNGKLSKRDGDKLGFPVFPLEWISPEGEISSGYKESGYFPDAFINLLALLGWNSGTEQEIFSMDELIAQFSLEKVGKSGAKFDPDKAKWFNHSYLATKSDTELAATLIEDIKKEGLSAEATAVEKVVGLVKERCTFANELWDQSFFFFKAPTEYDAKVIKKRWKEHTPTQLNELKERIANVESYVAENIKNTIHQFVEEKEIGMGAIMNALRLSLVGGGMGPDLGAIIEVLGKDETISRMEKAISTIER